MEKLTDSGFTIESMTEETYDQANSVRRQSWLDTYVNDEAGVTREWIESLHAAADDPARQAERRARVLQNDGRPSAAYVARTEDGTVIGETTSYRDAEGVQQVGSLYVDKNWQGRGVGSALMQKVLDWADSKEPIVLEVASYNEQAKAFYRKCGFEEVPSSERLHHGRIPVITMVRKGEEA